MKVRNELKLEEFPEYVKAIQSCGDHPLIGLSDEILEKVVAIHSAYIEEREDWEDTSSKIVVKLDDGRYGVFYEWSDSSGHGCQCDASWTICDSLEDAEK